MKKEKKKKRNYLVYILLIISLIVIYSIYIEPKYLTIKEYKIENKDIPDSFDGIKIIHFSDVHYKSSVDLNYIKKIIKKINSIKPDLVFFTGDFLDERYQYNETDIKNIENEFNKINSTLGNFAVTGDHDIKHKETFNKMFEKSFTILENEEKLLYYKETTPISLIGLSVTDVNYEVLSTEQNYYRFILTHEPDEYEKIKDYNFNIQLSGHSHNGQIRIPFIGAIYTPKGAKKYYDEYYKLNNKEIFISNGIGTSGINVRFNSRPSINLYRVYAY